MSNATPADPTGPSHRDNTLESSQRAWENNLANPFQWSEKKKWRVVLLAASVTLLIGLNATSVTTPSLVIAEEFHVSDEHFPHSYWPVTVWNTGAALGPMVGLPLLENFGIRNGYLLLYILFTLMVIPQAVAPNFATLLVTRALAGLFGGILQNAPEQIAADLWPTDKERNLPITFYTFVYVAGVTLGPAVGSIVGALSWRWVFYVQVIIYCALFPVVVMMMKETRGPVILSRLATTDESLKKASAELPHPQITKLLSEAISRPAHLLFTEPVIFFLTLWAAFCFGLVFIMTQSIAQVYSTNYTFTDSASGLVQISLFVGECVGFIACLPQNTYYQRSAARNTIEPGVPIPEARLPLSIPASLIGLAGGLFWYGWASFSYIHWIVPTIGLAFVGFAVMVIITAVDMYITDSYTKFAGSAIAAVALGENLFAAWLPLATHSMYTNLGFQWASSLLGFVAVVLTLAPIVLLWKGKKIRGKSPFIREAKY
ncbi:MAG: hypothetical protein Q9186_002866 [Xanthomendoza sp. 1 TL-2023]